MPQEANNTNDKVTPQSTANDTTNYAPSITKDSPMGSDVQVLADGTYVVGSDMPPGDFLVMWGGDNMGGSYTITTPGSKDITANVDSKGDIITLSDGQSIKLVNALIMPKGAMDIVYYDDGTYLVGSDIEADTYMLMGDEESDASTYVISSDKDGNDVISNGDLKTLDAPEVELKEGQYITLVGSRMVNMDNIVFINY